MKEKVEANHDLAILSRKLATIELNIDAEINIGAMIRQDLDENLLRNILEDLEFRTLLNKLISVPTITHAAVTQPEEPKEEATSEPDGQLDMFSVSVPDPKPTSSPEVFKEVVYQKF